VLMSVRMSAAARSNSLHPRIREYFLTDLLVSQVMAGGGESLNLLCALICRDIAAIFLLSV